MSVRFQAFEISLNRTGLRNERTRGGNGRHKNNEAVKKEPTAHLIPVFDVYAFEFTRLYQRKMINPAMMQKA